MRNTKWSLRAWNDLDSGLKKPNSNTKLILTISTVKQLLFTNKVIPELKSFDYGACNLYLKCISKGFPIIDYFAEQGNKGQIQKHISTKIKKD